MTIFSRVNNIPTRGAFLETMKNIVLTTIPLLSEFMKLKYSHDLAVTSKIYFNIQESCMYNCKYKKQNSSVKGNFKRNFNGRKINEMLDRSNPDKRYMIACSTFLLPFKRRKKIVPFLLLRYKYCSASSQLRYILTLPSPRFPLVVSYRVLQT